MKKAFKITGPSYECLCCTSENGCDRFPCRQETTRNRLYSKASVAKLHFHQFKNRDTNCPNGKTFKCACSVMPDYAQGYTGHIPTNLWSFCEKTDIAKNKRSCCPVRAYPLSCSEFGSPCLESFCKLNYDTKEVRGEKKKPLKYGDYGTEGYLCTQTCGKYAGNQMEPKSCCSSCSKGGTCKDDRKFKTSNSRSYFGYENSIEFKNQNKCKAEIRNQSSESQYRLKHDGGIDFRRGGVIPSYMGHIPGLHFAFGSAYGLTANRLLARHFKEMDSIDY